MKTRSLLLLGCLLASAAYGQTSSKRELWVWKDANGVTHYSDIPAPGAKKIEIINSTPVAPPAPGPAPYPSARTAAPAVQNYTALEFTSPEDGATFFGADAVVEVRLHIEPGLAPDDRLDVYMDGQKLAATNATERTLSNLERGEHTLTAVVVDAQGNEKIRSAARSFNVRQPTTIENSRNVGPSLKPPPKPQPKPAPTPTPAPRPPPK